MRVYAESSGVLAWVLDEPDAAEIRETLASAELVLTSELTLVECERALIRLVAWQQRTQEGADEARKRIGMAAKHWGVLGLGADVLNRARSPFPVEPIRTLDALHLASALILREAGPELALLSLDDRVRNCGRSLGFEILPRKAPPGANTPG